MNMKLIMTSIAVSSLLAALAIAQPPRHTPRYTVTDLGTLPGGTFSQAASVNTNSLVSGVASAPDGTQHAVLRQGRRIIDITKPGIGGLNSGAFGVNERGQAAVQAETSALDPNGEDFCGYGTHLICLPFLWQNGAVTPLPTAVMYCAVVGSSEATKLLVHHGAEMNERNVFRSMALMWSVTNREKVCLQAVSRRPGTKIDQDSWRGVGISGCTRTLVGANPNNDPTRQPETLPQSSSFAAHCSLAYSALACLRIGMSGSASVQRVRKSW